MNLSKSFQSNSFGNRVALGALSIVLAVLSSNGASAATDWSQRPSWLSAADADSPSPAHPARRHSYINHDESISPFSPGSNNLALDVGQVFLMGDLGSKYADSIGTQLHYTYGVSDMFGFDSSLGYSNHSDGQYSMTTLLTGLRTNLSWYDKVVPHLIFGLGFYKPDIQISDASSISPVVFGIHMGPGVDLELTKQLFFGTALTFHDVFGTTKMTAKGPVDVGGTFTSFFLHAGVTF